MYWLPGWQERSLAEFRTLLVDRLNADGWVVDGNYAQQTRDLLWSWVDTVVWLDLPRSTVMRQVTWRTLLRWWRREVLWGTNVEDMRKTLLSGDSVLWWAWSTRGRRRAGYEKVPRPRRSGWSN